MKKLARGALLLLFTLVGYPPLFVVMVVPGPWRRARQRTRNWLFRTWSRCCLRVMGCRLSVEGEVPRAPFFLVANHLSYIDILVLAAVVDVFFIAKSEISGWPGLGLLSRTVGTIFINRELRRDVKRVNRLVERTLDEGYGVVLFPEGTSTQGYEVIPFKSSLLHYPAQERLPVLAASLSYRATGGHLPANLSVCWWGDASFSAHFWQFLGIPGFEATVRFVSEPVVDPDRKALAASLRRLVADAFDPVVSFEERATETGLRASGE